MSESVKSPPPRPSSRALDAAAVRNAYKRWAGHYDTIFGQVSGIARRHGVNAVNQFPGQRVLEMGVGTGLALPHYRPEKRVTGIDLSADMLERARARVAEQKLAHVEALLEMDAEATTFPDNAFDIAVAMFVASVVPNPRKLMAEMKRLVRPGGQIFIVGHFASAGGPRWWVERAMAPFARQLGWHPDFSIRELFDPADLDRISLAPLSPLGIWSLVYLRNLPA